MSAPHSFTNNGMNPKGVLSNFCKKSGYEQPIYITETTPSKKFASVVEVAGRRYAATSPECSNKRKVGSSKSLAHTHKYTVRLICWWRTPHSHAVHAPFSVTHATFA
jgi:hypothetical protein